MTLISQLEEHHIIQLHQLYQNEWWTHTRSLEDTRGVVDGSQLVLGLINETGELIAFSRVLTDFTIKALIFDLIVAQQYRGQGLASRLINAIKQYPSLDRVRHFELYCLPELYDFYKQHGFSEQLDGVSLMRYTG